eukprot:829779_1
MDLQDQKIVVSQLYDQGHSELILGTTYYVACARWLHKWRAFVNWEARASPDNSSGSEDEAAQAPEFLDNSALVVPIGKDRIKMGLLEHEDYELIPESVWKQLTKWYASNIEFKRKVFMDSNGQLSVEIWPLHFRLFVCKDGQTVKSDFASLGEVCFSRTTPVKEVVVALQKKASIPDRCASRLWRRGKNEPWDRIPHANTRCDPELLLQNSHFVPDDDLLLETALSVKDATSGHDRHKWPLEKKHIPIDAVRPGTEEWMRSLKVGDKVLAYDYHYRKAWHLATVVALRLPLSIHIHFEQAKSIDLFYKFSEPSKLLSADSVNPPDSPKPVTVSRKRPRSRSPVNSRPSAKPLKISASDSIPSQSSVNSHISAKPVQNNSSSNGLLLSQTKVSPLDKSVSSGNRHQSISNSKDFSDISRYIPPKKRSRSRSSDGRVTQSNGHIPFGKVTSSNNISNLSAQNSGQFSTNETITSSATSPYISGSESTMSASSAQQNGFSNYALNPAPEPSVGHISSPTVLPISELASSSPVANHCSTRNSESVLSSSSTYISELKADPIQSSSPLPLPGLPQVDLNGFSSEAKINGGMNGRIQFNGHKRISIKLAPPKRSTATCFNTMMQISNVSADPLPGSALNGGSQCSSGGLASILAPLPPPSGAFTVESLSPSGPTPSPLSSRSPSPSPEYRMPMDYTVAGSLSLPAEDRLRREPAPNIELPLIGLYNLGNTCFMNSSLQCLVSCRALSEYFLSGRYRKEINSDNPLGTGGRLVRSYARLLKSMQGGSAIHPFDFKSTIGQFATQFSGYGQHDSQEFMNFLLDGLHEDVNRVRDKPYTVLEENHDGRPDEELAEEAWELHLKRNRSVIVDLFQGQLKSAVTCPDCNLVSVKFDPLMYLTLPLVRNTTRTIRVAYTAYGKPTVFMDVEVNKYARGLMLKSILGDMVNVKPVNLVGAIIENSIYDHSRARQKYLRNKEDIRDQIHPSDLVQTFEKRRRPGVRGKNIKIDQYKKSADLDNPVSDEICADPRFCVVSVESKTTFRELHQMLLDIMRPFFPDGTDLSLLGLEFICLKSHTGQCARCGLVSCYGCIIPVSDELLKNPEQLGSIRILWTEEQLRISIEERRFAKDPQKPSGLCGNKSLLLRDCFNLFTRPEKLGEDDMWLCPKCKTKKRATKQMNLWKLPQFLIVGLKRFDAARNKVSTLVEFPLRGLDLSDFVKGPGATEAVYDLVAVSNHYGSLGGGHYTATVRRGTSWASMNDASVGGRGAKRVVSENAYIMIYERRASVVSSGGKMNG